MLRFFVDHMSIDRVNAQGGLESPALSLGICKASWSGNLYLVFLSTLPQTLYGGVSEWLEESSLEVYSSLDSLF